MSPHNEQVADGVKNKLKLKPARTVRDCVYVFYWLNLRVTAKEWCRQCNGDVRFYERPSVTKISSEGPVQFWSAFLI